MSLNSNLSIPFNAHPAPGFLFVICQHGAEKALKAEIAREHPQLRFAFSRPGFVTFKVDPIGSLPEKFALRSTLARTAGWSLGKVSGEDALVLADDLINKLHLDPQASIHLHVFQRDGNVPGTHGFEPGPTQLAHEIANVVSERLQSQGVSVEVNRVVKPDEWVIDLVLVEPQQWWFGYHVANTVPGRWPGGVPPIDTSKDVVSRAYFKALEALEWSGIEILPEHHCAEIGSSPGGCCQLLLEKGARVIGIDPALMDSEIQEHPNFTHLRRRGHEVRKRDLSDVKWLFADLNIVPNYTLDTISEIVSHQSVNVTGVVLTLKLTDWNLIHAVPDHMQRLRSLGLGVVKARQLAFNRQEYCLVGIKDKFALRIGKKTARQAHRNPSSSDDV